MRWHARSAARWASALLAAMSIASPGTAAARDRGADGRFEQRESSHFVLFQDVDIDESGGLRGSRRFEQQVLDELERAYDRLDELLGLRPGRPIEVFVYDPGIFDTHFAGRFRFQAAGFFNGAIHIRGATQLTLELGRVLHHELVHAAFDAAAPSLVLPAWLNEGVAEWFEARALSKRHLSHGELAYLMRANRSGAWLGLGTLNRSSFAGLGQDRAQLAYLQAYGMIEHLTRRHGEGALRELCRAVVRSRDIERSLQRTLRMDSAALEASFREELS